MTEPADSRPPGSVFLVDDDDSFRRSIARLLDLAGFPVRTFPSVGDFLVAHPKEECGCLLLDMRMPGPDGMELLEHFHREQTGPPVVFLTGHGEVPSAVEAMRKGAFDFLTKPVEKETLVETVRKALRHAEEARSNARERTRLRERFSTLSPTERTIFRLVVDGLPNKAIADETGLAERTVKLHRSNLSRKLGAQCVADLVRFRFEADLR